MVSLAPSPLGLKIAEALVVRGARRRLAYQRMPASGEAMTRGCTRRVLRGEKGRSVYAQQSCKVERAFSPSRERVSAPFLRDGGGDDEPDDDEDDDAAWPDDDETP